MQGLFGRFGKKTPEQSVVANANFRKNDSLRDGKTERRSPSEDEDRQTAALNDWDRTTSSDRDFPISSIFDDDEETNWDDAETLADDNNRIVYAQPTVPEAIPPIPKTTLDLDDWDDALPAPTVRDRNTPEARRGTTSIPLPTNEDIWDDIPLDTNIPLASPPTFSPNPTKSGERNNLRDSSTPEPVNRVVGVWAGLMQQFRRILPAQIQQFADAIAIAIIVAFVTIGIWFVDGFFVPKMQPSVANPPPAPVATPAAPPSAETASTPQISPEVPSAETANTPQIGTEVPSAETPSTPQSSPEQVFIEEIEAQLSELTSQYPADLISSLSVDLARDRLIVRLSPAWYTIDDEQQNSLTDRMWQQAQDNHFTKLEVKDSQGVSIARSPVVGKHPIILQRRAS